MSLFLDIKLKHIFHNEGQSEDMNYPNIYNLMIKKEKVGLLDDSPYV